MSSRDRNPQIYIAKLSPSIREKDLADRFDKYGDIRRVQVKNGYAFIEYYDYRDAEYAVERMDGRTFDGHKIIVQPSMGKRRGREGDRDGERRGRDRDRNYSKDRRNPERKVGPQTDDVCFNCGGKGHWFNECKEPKKIR
jgi:RNA recognition motif-containing protein